MLMFLCFSSFPPRFYSSDPLRYNGRSLPFPWGADNTQKILDVLAKYNVKTTFFVVGNWADQYPDTVKAITAAGHEVMMMSSVVDFKKGGERLSLSRPGGDAVHKAVGQYELRLLELFWQ